MIQSSRAHVRWSTHAFITRRNMWLILGISQEYSCHHQYRRRGGLRSIIQLLFLFSVFFFLSSFCLHVLVDTHPCLIASELFGKGCEFIYWQIQFFFLSFRKHTLYEICDMLICYQGLIRVHIVSFLFDAF